MGIYLNWSDGDGHDAAPTGKADVLRRHHGAIDYTGTFDNVPDDYVLVVVVENGPWDAANIPVDTEEWAELTDTRETRRRQFLLVRKDEIQRSWPATLKTLEVRRSR